MTQGHVGFVGLGLMGAPMAANLVRAGWRVTGWNRSPAAVRDLELLGGAGAGNVADLRDEPVIIFMLPDLPFIEEASDGLLDAWRQKPPAPGTLVVVMSSVSPVGVQAFGQAVADASAGNASVIDAPVSGGTVGAQGGTLAIMAGGTAADFGRARPVLEAMGSSVRLLGGLGAGSLAKACNQLIVGTTAAALARGPRPPPRSAWHPRRRHSPKPRNSPSAPGWTSKRCLRSCPEAWPPAACWKSWDRGWPRRTTRPPARQSSC